jgi:hypothetical protein
MRTHHVWPRCEMRILSARIVACNHFSEIAAKNPVAAHDTHPHRRQFERDYLAAEIDRELFWRENI